MTVVSTVASTIKNGASIAWDKFKLGIDLSRNWLPFLNDQFKWTVAIIIRASAITLSVVVVFLIVKYAGLKHIILNDVLEIKPKKSEVISSPGINYNQDLQSIDSIINMMESKKKQVEKK